MDKVNRENSVFENQKEDVQRHLGEAVRDMRLELVDPLIISKLLNALAVLDNMEEEAMGPPPQCSVCGHYFVFSDYDGWVCLDHPTAPAHADGTQKCPECGRVNLGKVTCLCKSKPPADVGCPRSDAMGGTEEPQRKERCPHGYHLLKCPWCDAEEPCKHDYGMDNQRLNCSFCGAARPLPETITEEQAAAGLEIYFEKEEK